MATQKMTVIYKAPEGDAKTTQAFGHTFEDGKPTEIEVSDEIAAKIKNNPTFHPGGKAEPHPQKPEHDKADDKHK